MENIRFDSLVPLLILGDIQLGATGVRALENFSDLVHNHAVSAPLKMMQRLDITEDFLDLVIVRPDLPVGYEFSGISVASFRAALISDRHHSISEPWLKALASESMLSLHKAAQQRIAIRPKTATVRHLGHWLPKCFEDQPYVPMPENLQRILQTSKTGWKLPKRSRNLVELVTESGSWDFSATTRGKRFRVTGDTWDNWVRWYLYRLIPQHRGKTLADFLGDYAEYQLVLPSLESSYFSNHFVARNVFAHLRVEFFHDDSGRHVMLLHEVQSDWLRDLRLQRQGKARTDKPSFVGQKRQQRKWETVPECPVAENWLALALEAAVRIAKGRGCALIAWVPGKIQSEMNPGLPLSASTELYDKKIRRLLSNILKIESSQPGHIEYSTYQRNVLVAYKNKNGYFLTAADGKTPCCSPVPDEETLMAFYRAQAIPCVEQLPSFDLTYAPSQYAQAAHVTVPVVQPNFDEEQTVCG
jgi:hypothetical protein